MAYFNNAFYKTFVVNAADVAAGTATQSLAKGELGLVTDNDWETIATPGGTIPTNSLAYLVQGSLYDHDSIGNNPGHGGYQESVKSKGINPRYIQRIWEVPATTATAATASLSLGPTCIPCGTTQFMRMDVKGSPALRFLNHNAYAIGDSANICCIDGQEYLDPALVLATEADMILMNPLIKPFVKECDLNGLKSAGLTLAAGTGYSVGDALATTVSPAGGTGFKINVLTITGGGATGPIGTYSISAAGSGYKAADVVTIVQSGSGGNATLTVGAGETGLTVGGVVVDVANAAGQIVSTVYTIAQAKGKAASGNYVASTTPNAAAAKVTATVHWCGAYVDTKFGNCSFDTRDHYNAEPVEIIASILDETGNPCNDCGTAARTPGSMQQTQGEEVIRALILSERYRQSPYNQGNADSARIREIEMSDDLLDFVDRKVTYKAYYVQHVVPRFNNPSGVFDHDQYVYQIFVKDSDTAAKTAVEAVLDALVTLAVAAGQNIAMETING